MAGAFYGLASSTSASTSLSTTINSKIRDHLDQLPRFRIVVAARVKIRPHAVPQILGLADIHDLARRILVDVDTGVRWNGFEFLGERHTSILAYPRRCRNAGIPARMSAKRELRRPVQGRGQRAFARVRAGMPAFRQDRPFRQTFLFWPFSYIFIIGTFGFLAS